MKPGKLYKTKYEITFDGINAEEYYTGGHTLPPDTIVLFLKSSEHMTTPWTKKYVLHKGKILIRIVRFGDFESWFEKVSL